MLTKTKECAFCPARATTGEHVWSAWANKLLGVKERYLIQTNTKGIARKYKSVGLNEKFPALCDDCNNVWGSNFETRMKLVVADMVSKGTPKDLDNTDVATIMGLCLLKSFVCDHIRDDGKPSFYSRGERHAFRRNSTIPNGLQVWLARTDGSHGISKAGYGETPLNLPDRHEIYIFTVSLGQLVVQIASIRWAKKSRRKYEAPPVLMPPFAEGAYTIRVWPPDYDFPVHWPPPRQLKGESLNTFVDRWKTLRRGY
jgi:hypothetical protein